jgi:hypothetical protein
MFEFEVGLTTGVTGQQRMLTPLGVEGPIL